MNKTLYFEGAGIVPRGDLENCRIRTAFHLDNGKRVYLEISGFEADSRYKGKYKFIGTVDHLHYITGSNEDENRSGIYDNLGRRLERVTQFEFCRESILKLVNDLGASFDNVHILPDLAGYRVHAGRGKYNFADEFIYNEDRTKQAEKIKQYFYDKEKEKGVKYPCFSIWFDNIYESETLKVRFFDGRGTIEIPDVYAFEFK